ncbi:hypothetical protein RHSP_64717 [Rhizobium freirei PRF 81]|uniref:Uncharacterized protein n=1 Tax=Rhizobium freirei PRF 81 TaxID=363754 RepID=N6VC63_9HYPH|nr:hypothetical protein RHSP_64717 [Rhizobium freirei PRF 81]
MPHGDGAAVRVHMRRVVRQAEVAQRGERLRSEGFVQLDEIHLADRKPCALQHAAGGRRRAYAHNARLDAGGSHRDHACLRRQTMLTGCIRICKQESGRTIIDARSIAGGDRKIGIVDAPEFRKLLDRGTGTRMFVAGDKDRLALRLRHADRHDLVVKQPGGIGGSPARLAASGKGVLVGARNTEVSSDIVGGFRHGIDTEFALHLRINEAPADGSVVDGTTAREGTLGLRHDKRSAAHAFDATRNHQVAVAGANGTRRRADSIHTGAAEAIDGGARDRDRHAGQQNRHACDIAIVLAGLVGAAVDDILDLRPVDVRIALDEMSERDGGQIVGAHRRERSAITADRRSHRIADESFGHAFPPTASPHPVENKLTDRSVIYLPPETSQCNAIF